VRELTGRLDGEAARLRALTVELRRQRAAFVSGRGSGLQTTVETFEAAEVEHRAAIAGLPTVIAELAATLGAGVDAGPGALRRLLQRLPEAERTVLAGARERLLQAGQAVRIELGIGQQLLHTTDELQQSLLLRLQAAAAAADGAAVYGRDGGRRREHTTSLLDARG
jgi:hypothetical protein